MLATGRELSGTLAHELMEEHWLTNTVDRLKRTKAAASYSTRRLRAKQNQLTASDAALSVPFIRAALPFSPGPRWRRRRRPLQTSAHFKQVATQSQVGWEETTISNFPQQSAASSYSPVGFHPSHRGEARSEAGGHPVPASKSSPNHSKSSPN